MDATGRFSGMASNTKKNKERSPPPSACAIRCLFSGSFFYPGIIRGKRSADIVAASLTHVDPPQGKRQGVTASCCFRLEIFVTAVFAHLS